MPGRDRPLEPGGHTDADKCPSHHGHRDHQNSSSHPASIDVSAHAECESTMRKLSHLSVEPRGAPNQEPPSGVLGDDVLVSGAW